MKKGLTILLVLSLLVSIMSPFSVSATLPTSTDVTGTGSVISYQTWGDVLGGVLPTGNDFNFTIDPLGLLGVTAGGTIASATPSSAVTFTRDTVQAWNTSSIPVIFSAELTLTASTSGDTYTTMWVEPNAVAQTEGSTSPFVGIDRVFIYGTAGNAELNTIQFLLDATAHEVVVNNPRVIEDNVVQTTRQRVANTPNQHGTALRFGGVIDATSDYWLDAGVLRIRAVFTMTPAPEGTTAVPASATIPYGWLATNEALVARPAGVVGSAGGAIEANANGWALIPAARIGVGGGAITGVRFGETWRGIAHADVNLATGADVGGVWVRVPVGTTQVRVWNGAYAGPFTVTRT